jgi:hypothetical protein
MLVAQILPAVEKPAVSIAITEVYFCQSWQLPILVCSVVGLLPGGGLQLEHWESDWRVNHVLGGSGLGAESTMLSDKHAVEGVSVLGPVDNVSGWASLWLYSVPIV